MDFLVGMDLGNGDVSVLFCTEYRNPFEGLPPVPEAGWRYKTAVKTVTLRETSSDPCLFSAESGGFSADDPATPGSTYAPSSIDTETECEEDVGEIRDETRADPRIGAFIEARSHETTAETTRVAKVSGTATAKQKRSRTFIRSPETIRKEMLKRYKCSTDKMQDRKTKNLMAAQMHRKRKAAYIEALEKELEFARLFVKEAMIF